MGVLGGAEIAAGESEHAALDCKRLRNFLPASLLKWMAHIGEISADGIDQPLRALPERVAKHFSATVHLETVGLAPLRQRVDAPGHGPLADAGRADLDAVEDLGELADHARIGNDRAEAVARDAVGLREAVELDGVIAPCAALEEPMRAIQRRRQEVAIGLVDDEPESAPAAKVRNVLDDAIRVDRAGGVVRRDEHDRLRAGVDQALGLVGSGTNPTAGSQGSARASTPSIFAVIS